MRTMQENTHASILKRASNDPSELFRFSEDGAGEGFTAQMAGIRKKKKKSDNKFYL